MTLLFDFNGSWYHQAESWGVGGREESRVKIKHYDIIIKNKDSRVRKT